MEINNVLSIATHEEFRKWLATNHATALECWVEVKRGKPIDINTFYYLDAVEEALCFGWIDSTNKIINEKRMQRFSPRKKNSPWTELNKERARRLEKLGLMTDAGRAVLPSMDPNVFKVNPAIESALREANVWETFKSYPLLYQRVRAYNVEFYLTRNPSQYEKSLSNLIEKTKAGKMYGEWNDYGRLLDY